MPEPPQPAVFRVNGKDYEIPTSFNIGEMCDAERYFGVEFGSEDATPGIRMAAAMLWIAIRRVDSTVSVDDIRSLPPSVFESLNGAGAARPPQNSADASSSNGASGEPSGLDTPPAPDRRLTGVPASDTGAISDPSISAASHPPS
jgi:hypothetical protein